MGKMGRHGELLKTLDAIRHKRADVFDRYLPDPTQGCGPQDIQNVLVIISASRGGSSFLYHLLSNHPDVIAPQGEEITFYKLAGLGLIGDLRDSDEIANDASVSLAQRMALARDILSDAGRPVNSLARKDFPVDRYLVDSVQRLLLQWPEIDFDCDLVFRTARQTLAHHLSAPGPMDTRSYWLDLLSALIDHGYPINPYFYDLPRDIVQKKHPSIPTAESPPFSSICLEEPPFVVPQPKKFPALAGGAKHCLLLKSSSNCYRIEFMKSLYPNARFSFIYLNRNPAGAINGLMDGWLSNGFYSQSLQSLAALNIAGYSLPHKPWSQHWWNFDSPPGWMEYIGQSLENVCAFQWRSAHEHVLRGIASGAIDRHIVIRYEDLLNQDTLPAQLLRALDFAGLRPEAVLEHLKSPSSIMSVNPPGPKKWMKRCGVILPALSEQRVAAVASRLGYNIHSAEEFV